MSEQRRSYGAGSLSFRSDNRGRQAWYGRWYVDGQRVQRKLGPKRAPGGRDGLTKAAAEAELRRQIATAAPTRAAGARVTVDEAGERYRAALAELGRKRSTLVGVESIFRVWITPHLGDRPLAAVTPEDIEDLIATMRRADLSLKTVHNVVGVVGALYRWALHPRRRWAASNPVEAVELPALASSEGIRYLTAIEIDVLADHVVAGEHAALDRALYITAAQTGLRQGELIALRWADVDLPAKRIRVTRSHVLGEFDSPKSARSSRSVPMSARVVAELTAWAKLTRRGDPQHLVFGEPATGEPLRRGALMRRYRRALADAKLPARRFHDLRHSFGTAAAGAGVPIRTLQQWMGHRDIATTMRYADYSPNAEEVAMVDRAFPSSHSSSHSESTEHDRGALKASK